MIDRVAGNKVLPESIRQDIIERTDGVPLFVEEITKAVLEARSEGKADSALANIPSPFTGVPAILDRKGDHSMPTLRNPRHERFAQELVTGKTADAAYVLAGYRENRSNAARLNANQDVQKRLAEIQSLGAERAAITVETLIAEAEIGEEQSDGRKGRRYRSSCSHRSHKGGIADRPSDSCEIA